MRAGSPGFAAALTASALVLGLAATASAEDGHGHATVSCGQTITHTTVLRSDVGPCPGFGIIVGADDVVLNLNGHRVYGMGQSGQGAGVYLRQRTGDKVMNGTVSDFNAGVVIEGGSSDMVLRVTAHDNLGGDGSDYGDGILIESSSDNRIIRNRTIHNGPFSGIGIVSLIDSDHPRDIGGTSTGNRILGNTVLDNNVGRIGGPDDNDGIRIEPSTTGSMIQGNHVSGSGLDGISLFRGSGDSLIANNVVTHNGFFNQVGRHGDGIIIFNLANNNVVEHNSATENAANGIQVRGPLGTTAGSTDNVIEDNTAVDNSQLPAIPSRAFGPTFDLKDTNPDCDSNLWFGNWYGTAYPDCTTTGGHMIGG